MDLLKIQQNQEFYIIIILNRYFCDGIDYSGKGVI